jgi:hypothetical protein
LFCQRGAAIQQQQTLSPRTPPLLKTRHLTAASMEGPNITVISDPSPEELDQLDFSSSSSEDCKVSNDFSPFLNFFISNIRTCNVFKTTSFVAAT